MHFEVLVEDPSGKCARDIFMRKIVGRDDTYRVIPYRGIGHVPRDLCGTWELLADAVHRGGATALKRAGWQAIGREKAAWAEHIAPYVDVERNASLSFQYFRKQVRVLAQ